MIPQVGVVARAATYSKGASRRLRAPIEVLQGAASGCTPWQSQMVLQVIMQTCLGNYSVHNVLFQIPETGMRAQSTIKIVSPDTFF